MQYYAIKENESGIETYLLEPLWQNINKKRIFFPLHHGDSYHYSLLVMDNIARKFIHMNSFRPTTNIWNHMYYKNAKKVVRDICLR